MDKEEKRLYDLTEVPYGREAGHWFSSSLAPFTTQLFHDKDYTELILRFTNTNEILLSFVNIIPKADIKNHVDELILERLHWLKNAYFADLEPLEYDSTWMIEFINIFYHTSDLAEIMKYSHIVNHWIQDMDHKILALDD